MDAQPCLRTLRGFAAQLMATARPSAVFEIAAGSVRSLGAHCLPLAVAAVMHVYPLCALKCVPLPRWSQADRRRASLLETIRENGLLVANAGSERASQPEAPVKARHFGGDLLVDGTFDYVSLASSADIVFFKAPLIGATGTVFCASDLRAPSVALGCERFDGSMRLSDTRRVTFTAHRVPRARFLLIQREGALTCVAAYQRAWFHLLLAEVHLARIRALHDTWRLATSSELKLGESEIAGLREYALHLLDDFPRQEIERLTTFTSTIKLRTSMLAQATAQALCGLQATPMDRDRLHEDAAQLRYIRNQPTVDHEILRTLQRQVSMAG